ncbi:MAG TPA: glycosyltransferase [Arenibaculum sp.]|nr:glycosyltransferase [Arenibaculum sp.]
MTAERHADDDILSLRLPVGTQDGAPALRPAPAVREPPRPPALVETDVAFLADFSVVGESAWRIEAETRIQAQSGYDTVFIHLANAAPDAPPDARLNPMLAGCLDAGIARPVDPAATAVRCRLLVLHQPDLLFDRLLDGGTETVPRILADRVIAVAGEPATADAARRRARRDAMLRSLFGPVLSWMEPAGAAGPGTECWTPATWLVPGRRPGLRHRPVIGCIVPPVRGWFVPDRHGIGGYGASGHDAGTAGLPPGVAGLDAALHALTLPGATAPPPPWQEIGADRMDPVRFIGTVDILVPPAWSADPVVSDHAVAHALVRGIPVILPPGLRPRFGDGPIYAAAEAVAPTLRRLLGDAREYRSTSLASARIARRTMGPDGHRARLHALTGVVPRPLGPERTARGRPSRTRRILFTGAGDVGLGHLTRLLAVARHCGAAAAPVFACIGPGLRIVEQAGYPAEFLTPGRHVFDDTQAWNAWLGAQFEAMLDAHDPAAVVVDGSTLHDGLVRAVGRRRGCSLVWIRRAMWRPEQANGPLLARERFCDLVVEPADLAEACDRGHTVAHRGHAIRTEPIRLLDREDLLDRTRAAAKLGLDPDRPAALIQLGAGTNRDVARLIDAVLAALARHREIQTVIADWVSAPAAPDLWPGIRRVRGFPLSRYFDAFDLTVSAAGYNSFHEILAFGLPALFLPNLHGAMDDQRARAAFAQAQGCAFHLDEPDPAALDPLLDALAQPKVRALLRGNCRRLARPNGAPAAAAAIMDRTVMDRTIMDRI